MNVDGEPVPVGTLVAVMFRVAGYARDGSAQLEQIDCHGQRTGWQFDGVGLSADAEVVVEAADELHQMTNGFAPRGGARRSAPPAASSEERSRAEVADRIDGDEHQRETENPVRQNE